jgi:beta-1,4-mannosyltransferase
MSGRLFRIASHRTAAALETERGIRSVASTSDASARSPASARETRRLRVIAHPALGHRGANPYTWLLYSHMQAAGSVEVEEYSGQRLLRGRFDVLHVHWPEGHLNQPNLARALHRSISRLAVMRWARARGTKIIWTVHNLHAHERLHPRLERWFWRRFLGSLDGFISLTRSGAVEALARFPELARVPEFIVPAGHYREAYASAPDRQSARRRLGIRSDARVLAFVGLIRPYKNVPELVNAFIGLRDDDAILLVAGEPKTSALATQLENAASADPRMRLHLRWIPDDEITTHLAAADLVVLPYREILNSGSALLALSFDRPVLVPAKGSLAELQDLAGPDWVRTYSGVLSTSELSSAMEWATEADRPASPELHDLEWSRIAVATLSAYRTVTAGREPWE